MASAQKTTDHKKIRQWVEERGGRPATVEQTQHGDEAGILRIDFPVDGMDEGLAEIEWDEFFDKFEESGLAFLHQEQTEEGEVSRFCKFVDR